MELRLILGDQLNEKHSWFQKLNNNVMYTMMEIRQETEYVLHHSQKIIALFAAMRTFSNFLKKKGHIVYYLKISSKKNKHSLTQNLNMIISKYHIKKLCWQLPDEYRLDQQIKNYSKKLNILVESVDSEHFYTKRNEVEKFFFNKKKWVMEKFYRHMRKRYKIIMNNKKPKGNKWNYDKYNRSTKKNIPNISLYKKKYKNYQKLWTEIKQNGVYSFGSSLKGKLIWPINRKESLKRMNYFISHVLYNFGKYQDIMINNNWQLFHSLLSFSLNTKMISPREVVKEVELIYLKGKISIESAEGFIRQILGWREYIRGVYWSKMPDYINFNWLNQKRKLPSYFWNGKTKMRCVSIVIKQSLKKAYAHHIQRLMIIGNFALLSGLNPYELHKWYLGVYIDAFEWVEAPNTLGLSQYADGGLISTKPYVSSSNYINKMSNYCKNCFYQYKKKYGFKSCPYNSLYWDFFIRYKNKLEKNYRLSITYVQLSKMSINEINSIKNHSSFIRKNLEEL